VPTIAEAGVPGYSGTSWFTFAAPRGMPTALVDKLNRDVQRVLASARGVRRKLEHLGINFTPNTPQQAAAFFRSETPSGTA
jgi:tripartite-type tricarboxylate transporter receptor subunit TctC